MKDENAAEGGLPLPIYIRLPKSGTREFYTGLKRTALYKLITPCTKNGFKPPVKSIEVKLNRNATRGTRHILLQSLLDYMASLKSDNRDISS